MTTYPAHDVPSPYRPAHAGSYAGAMEQPFAEWSEFNVAVAGAGAALGGLLIVGVLFCCLALIPGQVTWGFGLQMLLGTGCGAAVGVVSALR